MGFFLFGTDDRLLQQTTRRDRLGRSLLNRPRPQTHHTPTERVLRRRDFPGQEILLELLSEGDRLRENQKVLADKLKRMLITGYPSIGYDDCCRARTEEELAALRNAWDQFLARGGVSTDDLNSFISGEPFGTRNVVKKGELRLIRSEKTSMKINRAVGYDDDDRPAA
jgi:hypothetical protein